MSYWETLLVIMRRWRISVPATLIAFAVGAAAFFAVPPTFEDESQLLFIGSPRQAGEKALVNPYLDLGSTLISTADVIRAIVSTQQVADGLAAAGATAQYAVALDQSTTAPVLIVTTTAHDSAVARRTTEAVIAVINENLVSAQRNAGAPRATWVTTTVISSQPRPKRNLTDSIRPAIVAVIGVLSLTMFVLFLLEGRRQRRREQPAPAAPIGTGEPLEPLARNGRSPHPEHGHSTPAGSSVAYATKPIPLATALADPVMADPAMAKPVATRQPPAWPASVPAPARAALPAPIAEPGTGSPDSSQDQDSHRQQAPRVQVPRLLPAHPTPHPAAKEPDENPNHGDSGPDRRRASWGSDAEGRATWRR